MAESMVAMELCKTATVRGSSCSERSRKTSRSEEISAAYVTVGDARPSRRAASVPLPADDAAFALDAALGGDGATSRETVGDDDVAGELLDGDAVGAPDTLTGPGVAAATVGASC